MPRISFRQPGGEIRTVEASNGQTLMEVATGAALRGIVGECGGCCSCATCHVYVDADWFGKLKPADDMELAMLEGAVEPGPLSRLSCQIVVSDALEGLQLSIPAGQV